MVFLSFRTKLALVFSIFFASISTYAQPLSTEVGDVPAAPINYQLEEIAGGFNHPSSIAFLPSGDFLITERNAGLTVVSSGTQIEVEGMPEIYAGRQAGLHDVALHPDYVNNGLIYFSYSHQEGSENGTRLSRAKLLLSENGEQAELQDLEVLFTRTPLIGSSAHYGGRIVFLKDGTLLLTLGEGSQSQYRVQALDMDSLLGKIVRLNADGSIPSDNPFLDTPNARPEIFTYGHRNPQGLITLPDGTILSHEHGPRGGDEINEIRAGSNYGWPEVTYGIEYSGAIVSPFFQREGTAQSIIHYVPSIAPSGFTHYDGDLFPEWKGDLFVGGLVSTQVRRIDIGEDGSFGDQEKLFTELEARIRDIRSGPDGALYFVTDAEDGILYRVSPKTE